MTSATRIRAAGRARVRRLSGAGKVWLLVLVVAAGAVLLTALSRQLAIPRSRVSLPWPVMAGFFYVAELAVVHLRFRKDAHSFSMSEIPLVVGLYFMDPVHLVAAQAVANVFVLTVHRKLPPVKVAFNLSQFAVQTAFAIITFRTLVTLGDPFGPLGWIAATAAAMVALLIADLLINTAIHLSGGRLDVKQMAEVLVLSALAAAMNVSLALVAVTVMEKAPDSAWLALSPPVVLFVAYRAYVLQRQEGGRLQSLYEATRALHRSPQIESALLASASQAIAMFEVEFAEILLFPELTTDELFPAVPSDKPYLTAVGPGDRKVVMEPCGLDLRQGLWPQLIEDQRAFLLQSEADALLVRPHASDHPAVEAVVAPLLGQNGVLGAFIVANRLGDVSILNEDDVDLLETLTSQVAVSLENGRLEDSLAQLTELKDQLEALVRSKDQFVATVSHELRTPLTAIFGLSHELHGNRDEFTPGEMDELITVIAEQSAELSELIEDLLVAARAESGRLHVEVSTVELRSEVETILESHRWSNDSEPTLAGGTIAAVPVSADPLRLRQIIRNLLTNADRYGGDEVWVEIEGRSDTVALMVKDTGSGVPQGFEAAIFEPYQSAHGAGTQPASVGLGLAVSRQLARLMDGDLLYHQSGGVTCFELILRRAG